MFGWGTFERLQEIQEGLNPDAAKKKEAEELILKIGKGICTFCKEEIVKNETMPGAAWIWESESMVGWCDAAKDHKHRPIVRWTSDGGVQNVQ